ncbi:TRAP dicarboxylate transporter, dctq subunit [Sulfitobacter noctilucicola]|uniref:TRAP transporter small permease protein n=1 Tax=Sulfitobacter noctilucicola TaxID=1342301 RepID=A0A7W6M5K0_9RHOB|nr:TRAP transporter small permease subunit [Sulfitobacter noctilucicola]KIN62593.1 TRAP dicarboxylate transporter, dctq subunit [Sulfitobacter noctilucicola]MBB4172873.1 TRAP-type C4-dicarboxylate transport system permease small subunit [Sulfitobacter noctilucicola]
MTIWADAVTIVTSTLAGDIDFSVVKAYRSPAAWWVFTPITLLGGLLVHYIYMKVPFIERHLERTIIVWTYIVIALIIFVGVLQRFGPGLSWWPESWGGQVPWSTTIPPLLFMIMAWFGCAFNVKLRTHLSFSEFRSKMGPKAQISSLMLDNILWMLFCIIVVTTTARVTVNTYDNFAIVLGTDNVMRWWFIVTMPVCFIVMAGRVIGNMVEDLANYRNGEPLIKQAVIGGDV